MDGFESQEIDTEVEELFVAVKEILEAQQTNTVDIKPAISSENYKCERPGDGTENSPAMAQLTRDIPLLLHCRLCGMPDHNMVDIFGSNAASKHISSKINSCLPVTVKETDTLPKQVCWSCLEELDRCYRFHQTVAKADKQLLAFGRLGFIDLAETDRNDENSPHCDRQQKEPEHDFNETSNRVSGIEPSYYTSTSSSEPAQTADSSDETNDQKLRLKPCWVALSTIPTPCQNQIHATRETKGSTVSKLPNAEDFDIERTQSSGTGIRIVQQSRCDSEGSKKTSSKSAAKTTRGKETENNIGPAIHKRSRTQRGRYPCTKCEKVYKTKQSLIRHYKLHTGEGLYFCAYCGKKFSSREDGIRHERIHTGARPFRCTICDKRFAVLSNLKVHEALHSDKKDYPCSLCDGSFKTWGYRKRHYMLVHTGENKRRLWQCNQCKRNFTSKHNLVAHIKRCEGDY